jgi:hypothetical protein
MPERLVLPAAPAYAVGSGSLRRISLAPFRLSVTVVPRFDGDQFRTPDPDGVEEVPRPERLAQSRQLRVLLGWRCP